MADELPEINLGNALMAETPITFDPAKLSGAGIPVSDGSIVRMRDGSDSGPIQLPQLTEADIEDAFTYMLIMTAGKVMKRVLASPDPTKLFLVSRNGRFRFEEMVPTPCFPSDDICDCPPDWIAGWKLNEETGKLCLVKFSASPDGDVWEDTTSIDISGSGTEGSPFRASVKISAEDGNYLTVLDDGLYVGDLLPSPTPTP